MTDSLRDRVSRINVGSIHARVANNNDDTARPMIVKALHEIDRLVADISQEFGVVTANRHLVQHHHMELNRRHLVLSASAESAITEQREDHARTAVTEQLEIEAQIAVVRTTLKDLERMENELFRYLYALMNKRCEVEDQLTSVQASSDRATRNVADLGNNMKSSGPTSTVSSFLLPRPVAYRTAMLASKEWNEATLAAELKKLGEPVDEKKIEKRLTHMKAANA